MRRLAALLLIIALAPGTWLRTPPAPRNYTLALRLVPLPLPPRALAGANLGPFELEQVWQLKSPHFYFGGYSALVPLGQGQMLAVSDLGFFLRFTLPGSPPGRQDMQRMFHDPVQFKTDHDAEAATRDPRTGDRGVTTEGANGNFRSDRDLKRQVAAHPQDSHKWPVNNGPEPT